MGFVLTAIKMIMKNILLLGSQSQSRQQLLREVQIPFTLVEQRADESQCDWGLPLPQLVQQVALYKMDHVVLPAGKEGEHCFVLTADTLSQDMQGNIHGKPADRDDAIAKIKAARQGSRLCTAFYLDKKVWRSGQWEIAQRIHQCVHAEYRFVVPDEWIDTYLEKSWGMTSSNAIAIEGFGGQFLQSISGSYTTVVGLPLFELREALTILGFFF